MDSDSIIMLLVMILLTALSGYFSATETAFSSFNRIRMKSLASSGNKDARAVLLLDDMYDRLITSILIGNNIANIALTTLSALFFIRIMKNSDSDVAATVSTIVTTVVVLIFGEVSPKTLAKDHADGFCLATHGFTRFFLFIFYPFTLIFTLWKKLLCKIFKAKSEDITTEDDLITMVDEAEQDGGLDEDESELIRSAIEFGDLTAGEVLTPRTEMISVKDDSDPREIMMMFFETGFSRLPVTGENVDDIVGVLHEKDFFYAYNTGKNDYKKYYQKPLYVSKHIRVDDLLRDLQKEKCHMAFVVDEFGGLLGIVTMEDIIEELIGEVWDEHDEVENFIRENPDGSYTVDCSAELDDVFELFDIKYDDDDSEKPQTVNGWLQIRFEGLPDEGDSFVYCGVSVTITKCDEKMVKEAHFVKTDIADSEADNE